MPCLLIDELLNMELWRRDYKFETPKIPTDDEMREESDDGEQADAMAGTQEMFGIKIKQETDRTDLVGGTTTNRSKNPKRPQVEETKINFFDPSVYSGQEAPYEKPPEDKIIEARIDAVDWRAELDRVYADLVAIEKDTQLAMGYGGGLPDEIEDCRRHYELIEEMCREIRSTVTSDVRKVFQRAGETLEE